MFRRTRGSLYLSFIIIVIIVLVYDRSIVCRSSIRSTLSAVDWQCTKSNKRTRQSPPFVVIISPRLQQFSQSPGNLVTSSCKSARIGIIWGTRAAKTLFQSTRLMYFWWCGISAQSAPLCLAVCLLFDYCLRWVCWLIVKLHSFSIRQIKNSSGRSSGINYSEITGRLLAKNDDGQEATIKLSDESSWFALVLSSIRRVSDVCFLVTRNCGRGLFWIPYSGGFDWGL